MPLFICRWQDGDFSAVSAASRDEAMELLDEVGNGISGVMQLNQHRHFLSILQRHFCGCGATRLFWRFRSSRIATPERRNAGKMFMKSLGIRSYNRGNREPLFVPGGLPCTFWFPGSQSFSCGDC